MMKLLFLGGPGLSGSRLIAGKRSAGSERIDRGIRAGVMPILEVVLLQLLAYHIAVRQGCDVDQPRNLAKSVTVE